MVVDYQVTISTPPLWSKYGTYRTAKARFWPWPRPDSGPGFQVKVVQPCSVVLFSLGSGSSTPLTEPPFETMGDLIRKEYQSEKLVAMKFTTRIL